MARSSSKARTSSCSRRAAHTTRSITRSSPSPPPLENGATNFREKWCDHLIRRELDPACELEHLEIARPHGAQQIDEALCTDRVTGFERCAHTGDLLGLERRREHRRTRRGFGAQDLVADDDRESRDLRPEV